MSLSFSDSFKKITEENNNVAVLSENEVAAVNIDMETFDQNVGIATII